MYTKQALSTPDAPSAIGPYSQAIRIGNAVYTSGQIPIDPRTGEMVAGGISQQTQQVVKNLTALLAASGLTLAHVVKTTVFLKNMTDFSAMNEVYSAAFTAGDNTPPARSTIEVARLPKDALVEIECVAIGEGTIR